jgi:hypothetical protein
VTVNARALIGILLLELAFLPVYPVYLEAAMQSDSQAQVSAIVAKLANNEVGRIEILEMPPSLLTRTRITPEMLEAQFYYRLTIRDIRGGIYQSKLLAAAKSISVESRNETSDLRWATIFYSTDGVRLGAFYFDKTGSYGAVDSASVSFRGGFFKWLDGTFSSCFQ